MLVLDTNHVSELGYGTPAGLRLRDRLLASGEDTATTIITVEEQLRGWLAEVHRLADARRQIPAYRRLHERIEFFGSAFDNPLNGRTDRLPDGLLPTDQSPSGLLLPDQ